MAAGDNLSPQFGQVTAHLEGVHNANMDELAAHQHLFEALWGGTVHENRLKNLDVIGQHHDLLHNVGKMSSHWEKETPSHDVTDLSAG